MAKKSAVFAITISDDNLRLSLIGKSGDTIDASEQPIKWTESVVGVRTVDAFEIVHLVRTGFQQLQTINNVTITALGVSVMPGYLMAWNRETRTPYFPCFLPNNMPMAFQYQEFKFSSFYNLLLSKSPKPYVPNVGLNLWLLSKMFNKKYPKALVISGLDTWLMAMLSGGSLDAFYVDHSNLTELMLGEDFDVPLLSSINLNVGYFPQINHMPLVVTKNMSPIKNDIPILYAKSMHRLISNSLKSFTHAPVAFFHQSSVNHLYIENVQLNNSPDNISHWIRFSSTRAFDAMFGTSSPTHRLCNINLHDIGHQMVIPLQPFRMFHYQTYHMLNIQSFSSQNRYCLGVLQVIFILKYLISLYNQRSRSGSVQTLLSDTEHGGEGLFSDLCQCACDNFKKGNVLDLIHVSECYRQNQFFSSTVHSDLFRKKNHVIPSMDPLTCYALYQPWEDWFNKLYDYWG
jgi:hypothetical protein